MDRSRWLVTAAAVALFLVGALLESGTFSVTRVALFDASAFFDKPIECGTKPVRTFVHSICKLNGTHSRVQFGYEHSNACNVRVPIGVQNFVHPGALDRGQPTEFFNMSTPERERGFCLTTQERTLTWAVKTRTHVRSTTAERTESTRACTRANSVCAPARRPTPKDEQ